MIAPATPLSALLRQALAQGLCCAAQLCVWAEGRALEDHTLGVCWPGGPEVSASTPFDIASVSKVLGTTAAAMALVAEGRLDLDEPLDGALGAPALEGCTPRVLLGHRSGLAAWSPGFDLARRDPRCAGLWPLAEGGRDRAVARELTLAGARAAPRGGPPGARVYSDLNFILLGELLAQRAGQPLEVLAAERVFWPLGLHHTTYVRLGVDSPPLAPVTGAWRPREPAPGQEGLYTVAPQLPALVPGEVDDDNTWAMGGVAGHAGVFSTAGDLCRFGQAVLDAFHGQSTWLSPAVVRAFLAPDAPAVLPVRSLGFDRPSPPGSSVGERFGQRGPYGAVGHLGFTGSSLWIDLDRHLVVALLTNRTFPTRANTLGIRRLRPAVHEAAIDLLERR